MLTTSPGLDWAEHRKARREEEVWEWWRGDGGWVGVHVWWRVYGHMVIWWFVCGTNIRIRWCMFQLHYVYLILPSLRRILASGHIGCPSAIMTWADTAWINKPWSAHTSNLSEWAELIHRYALLLKSHTFFFWSASFLRRFQFFMSKPNEFKPIATLRAP